MEVPNWKQVGLARGEPFCGGGALTLRAMAVAAAVVGNDCVGAVFAARHMATERCRAAALDRTHHLHLVEADVSGIGTTPRRSVVAEDIRDLQRWTGHGAVTLAAGPSCSRCSWNRRISSAVAVSGDRFTNAANCLQLRMWPL